MSFNLQDCEHLLHECYLASSVEGAIAYLSAHHGEGLIIAGGTDLRAGIESGALADTRLVDVSRVGSMRRIAEDDGYVVCGGAVTFAMLAEDDLIHRAAPLLFQAGGEMGNEEVRRRATLGGNIVAARGNADGAVALVALDAEAEITNLTGAQWLPVASLYVRPGASRVDSTAEIVTAVRFRSLRARQGVDLQRIVHPGLDPHPLLVLALALALGENGRTIEWVSVVAGSAAVVPAHLSEVEEALTSLDADADETLCIVVDLTYERITAGPMLQQVPCPLSEDVIRVLPRRAFDRAVRMARRASEPVSA